MNVNVEPRYFTPIATHNVKDNSSAKTPIGLLSIAESWVQGNRLGALAELLWGAPAYGRPSDDVATALGG